MGIIGKQSVQSSLFIYVGFVIGALNTLVLFQNENYFTLEQFGLTKVLVDVSLLIGMLCTLGTAPAVVKFYPFYNSYLPKKQNDLPVITFFAVAIGCCIFLIVTPFCKEIIIRKFGAKSPLFVDHFNLIYPLSVSIAFFYLLEAYSWAIKKTVLPVILKELIIRIFTTVLIVVLMMGFISFNTFVKLFSLAYTLPVLVLLFSLLKTRGLFGHFKISVVTRRLKNRIVVFSLFIFSGQILNLIARTLDSIIISSQSSGGLKDTGVFTIATYFIALMEVPLRGMTGIAFAILSEAWKSNDKDRVFSVYKKTAINLLIAGLGIMGLVVLNIKNVITFLGAEYTHLAQVVIILGFSKLIDLGTGLNSQLLLSSRHWKIEFISNVFLVLMTGVFNYLLVRKYGIMGSAWATLLAFSIYNTFRFGLIYRLFKMQPFTILNLWAILIASLCFFIAQAIPQLPSIFLDTPVRSIVFIVLFVVLILKFKISADINLLYKKIINKLGW